MAKMVSIDDLVNKGELSSEAAEKLKGQGLWISHANELYGHLNMALNHGTDEVRERYAGILGIPVEKLSNFMDYIGHYRATEEVLEGEDSGRYQMGCLVTEEQLDELRERNRLLQTPKGRELLDRRGYVGAMQKDPVFRRHALNVIRSDMDARIWLVGDATEGSYEDFLKQFDE
tara:strand:- start:2498 stop:3019 length:522 start_codon:yes stop_codon:yes gene_type:complete